MNLIRLFPVLLSAALLSAHYLRASNYGLMMLCATLPLLLLLYRRWVARVVQIMLVLGSLVWVETAQTLVQIRQAFGQPWSRMAMILGGVVLLTAGSALLFETRSLRERYRGFEDTTAPSAAAFLLTGLLLGVIQLKVQPPVLLLERFLPCAGWVEALALATYAGWITEKMLDPRQSGLWRHRIWGFFSLVFFAQLILGLAGFERFLMTGDLHLPIPALIIAGPLYRLEGFFMLILFGITVLLVGPAWCSYLCYIGAWDDTASRHSRPPIALPKWRQPVRLGILLLIIITAIGLRAVGASVSVATGLAIAFGLVGIGVMVLWSRKTGVMTHCVAYCPIGVLATWLGRLSPFRIRIGDGCTECQACSLVCRYDALNWRDIKQRRPGNSCTLCGDCIDSCKGEWIEYRFVRLQPAHARALFIVLVVSLHAVFLGVARI